MGERFQRRRVARAEMPDLYRSADVFLHNLGEEPGTVDLSSLVAEAEFPNDVLADQEYGELGKFDAVAIGRYGYRWIRLRRRP